MFLFIYLLFFSADDRTQGLVHESAISLFLNYAASQIHHSEPWSCLESVLRLGQGRGAVTGQSASNLQGIQAKALGSRLEVLPPPHLQDTPGGRPGSWRLPPAVRLGSHPKNADFFFEQVIIPLSETDFKQN